MNYGRKILIDTDIAFGSPDADVDDTLALLLSLKNPDLRVAGISPVGGNVAVDKASRNLHALLSRLGFVSIPHAWSTTLPLDPACRVREERWNKSIEGKVTKPFDAPDKDSVDMIVEILKNAEEPITLVPIGPLTNIALAISKCPEIMEKIDEIVMMGGTFKEPGPYGGAEFNIWADAYAAALVFNSGIRITMFGLDVTKKRKVKPEDLDLWDVTDSPLVSELRISYLRYMRYRSNKFSESGIFAFFHDAFPIAYFSKPELFQFKPCRITVDLEGTLTFGSTLVDFRGKGPDGDGNLRHRIALDVDGEALLAYVVSTILDTWRGVK